MAEILNVNIFHITQYFWVKSYKCNQWNLPNIFGVYFGYIQRLFERWVSPFKIQLRCTENRQDRVRFYGDMEVSLYST